MDHNDADAFLQMGWHCHYGAHGLTQDKEKAFKLWFKASEIGSPESYNNVSLAYLEGRGVPKDKSKAFHYMELAAIAGDAVSRRNLATYELKERGNPERAVKHLMIGAGMGSDEALDAIKELFMLNIATKEAYATALRAHKEAVDSMTSEQRKEAAAANTAGPHMYVPPGGILQDL